MLRMISVASRLLFLRHLLILTLKTDSVKFVCGSYTDKLRTYLQHD